MNERTSAFLFKIVNRDDLYNNFMLYLNFILVAIRFENYAYNFKLDYKNEPLRYNYVRFMHIKAQTVLTLKFYETMKTIFTRGIFY